MRRFLESTLAVHTGRSEETVRADIERDLFLTAQQAVEDGVADRILPSRKVRPCVSTVSTVATGLAASMGQFLLTGGAPGKRLALPHAEILMHQPSSGIGGTESDIVIRADMLHRLKRQIAEITAGHSGQSVEQIEADFDRDRWFSPTEAAEYGLIDRVVSRP